MIGDREELLRLAYIKLMDAVEADAQRQVREFLEALKEQGLEEGEIRRLFEAELTGEFQRR